MADRPKLVADIMTRKVVTLFPEQNLEQIDAGMHQFGFRHLPVVDDGKLVGLVTHLDMLRVRVSPLTPVGEVRERELEARTFVQSIMTTDVQTVPPETPLLEAAKLLHTHKYGCLPVISEDGTLVGIVTAHDFLGLLVQLLDGD